jgi:hypothetical protein
MSGIGTEVHGSRMPEWLKTAYADVAQRSQRDVLGRPDFRFDQARIAADNPDLQAAYLRGRNVGQFDPGYVDAARYLRPGQDKFYEQYQNYMNPYNRNVTNRIAEEGNRNFEESILPALEARFVNLGTYGGSRHRDLAQRAARDSQKEILSNQRLAMHQGYQQAGENFNRDRLRQLEAGQRLGQLTGQRQASHMLDTGQLAMQGAQQQGRQDQRLGHDYMAALNQYNQPQERLAQHISNLQGVPAANLSQQYSYYQPPQQQQPQNSFGQNVAGIAAGLLGARFQHHAEGGYVHPAYYR